MKVDTEANLLTQSTDPYLPPWLPQNQFGWQIQDQNYFDLFFQDKRNPARKIPVDFYENIVLAIIKYDIHPWELHIVEVLYSAKRHHIHLKYSGVPLFQRAVAKQTSSLLVVIEQNKKIKKGGSRNLTFSVEKVGNKPEFLRQEGTEALQIFPLAFTTSRLQQQTNRRNITISKYIQEPESIVSGNIEALSDADKALLKMQKEEAALARKRKERELRRKQLEDAKTFAEARERENKSKQQEKQQLSEEEQLSKARENALALRRKDLKRMDKAAKTGADLEKIATTSSLSQTNKTSGNTGSSTPVKLEYLEPKGYMVRRDISLKAVNYLVLESKADWDAYIKTVPLGMTQISPLPQDFQNYIAIVVIKKGNTYWEMETQNVWQVGEELRVNYQAELSRENLGWEATNLYVTLIKRNNFKRITFLQNGEKVRELSLESP